MSRTPLDRLCRSCRMPRPAFHASRPERRRRNWRISSWLLNGNHQAFRYALDGRRVGKAVAKEIVVRKALVGIYLSSLAVCDLKRSPLGTFYDFTVLEPEVTYRAGSERGKCRGLAIVDAATLWMLSELHAGTASARAMQREAGAVGGVRIGDEGFIDRIPQSRDAALHGWEVGALQLAVLVDLK